MKQIVFKIALLAATCLISLVVSNEIPTNLKQRRASLCGGSEWIQYGEDRCFRLLDGAYLNRSAAEERCNSLDSNNPTLATIRNPQEQAFILTSVMSDSILDNVWIGAERKDETGSLGFVWTTDGSAVVYSNWAPDRPTTNTGSNCVRINSGYDKSSSSPAASERGQWEDVVCERMHLVLCEKGPTIPVDELTRMLLEMKRNPVPIGFIYTQLPGNADPQEIWPQVVWADVSKNYEGLFFRVMGGSAGSFGQVQDCAAPRITRIEKRNNGETWTGAVDVPIGWSDYVMTGDSPEWGDAIAIRVHTSNTEVRPKNTAVKIWQRID